MSGRPDLESLRILVLVGEHGSLGAAATVLGVSQPAVSKRLSTMERQLGLALVERTRRGSALTSDGRMVADWARRVLDELDALVTGVEALRGEQNAQLRVAASMTVAEHLAPGWIGELRRTAPRLHVGLQVTNSAAVADQVREHRVELGFVEVPTVPKGLSAKNITDDRLIVVVSPDHRWASRRRPLTVTEFAATPLVVREPGSGTRVTLDRALKRAKAEPVEPLLELGSTTAVRSAVIAGAGPAVLSSRAVSADLADGRLVAVTVEGVDLRRMLRAVWPSGRQLVGPAADLLAIAVRSGPSN